MGQLNVPSKAKQWQERVRRAVFNLNIALGTLNGSVLLPGELEGMEYPSMKGGVGPGAHNRLPMPSAL